MEKNRMAVAQVKRLNWGREDNDLWWWESGRVIAVSPSAVVVNLQFNWLSPNGFSIFLFPRFISETVWLSKHRLSDVTEQLRESGASSAKEDLSSSSSSEPHPCKPDHIKEIFHYGLNCAFLTNIQYSTMNTFWYFNIVVWLFSAHRPVFSFSPGDFCRVSVRQKDAWLALEK